MRISPLMSFTWVACIWRSARTKPLGAFSGLIILVSVLVALFAPALTHHPYDRGRLADRLQGPSITHWLGTDEQGRDLFARIIFGARVSLLLSFGAVMVATALATGVGVISGYYGGRVDMLLQRLVDVAVAFPSLVLLLTAVSIFPTPDRDRRVIVATLGPAEQRVAQIVLVLGLLFSFGSSRVVRSATIAIRHNQYLEAARAVGAGHLRILSHHLLPNVAPTILVLATGQLGAAILAESSLAFLGFGIPPPVPSWGQMLSGPARVYIVRQPLLAVWPGLAITLMVFAFNILGDALRDVLDPRLRRRRS